MYLKVFEYTWMYLEYIYIYLNVFIVYLNVFLIYLNIFQCTYNIFMVYLNLCIVYLNVFECTYNIFVVYFNVPIIYFNAFIVCLMYFNVFECIYRHYNWISPLLSHCNVFAMYTHLYIFFSLYTMTPFPTCYTTTFLFFHSRWSMSIHHPTFHIPCFMSSLVAQSIAEPKFQFTLFQLKYISPIKFVTKVLLWPLF
jgi:hypothetical protein